MIDDLTIKAELANRALQDRELDEVAGGKDVPITCTTPTFVIMRIISQGDTPYNPWLTPGSPERGGH